MYRYSLRFERNLGFIAWGQNEGVINYHSIWKYMLKECCTFIVAICMIMFQCQGICIVMPVSGDFERKEGDCFLSLARIK